MLGDQRLVVANAGDGKISLTFNVGVGNNSLAANIGEYTGAIIQRLPMFET